MKLFKTIDEKLKKLGFIKINENKFGVEYERYNHKYKYKYTHCVDIKHKSSGNHIIQSYDKTLFDNKNIGNTNVGLTYKENKLFLKKMKKLKLS